MRKILLALPLLFLLLFLFLPTQAEAQAEVEAQPAAAPLPVVASFSILGDIVRNVGGEAVAVKTLVGPDGDAHTYEPTPDDAKAIAGARLVFVNGLGFEGWMDRLIAASGYRGTVVTASRGVSAQTMADADVGGTTVTDPHAWQDLSFGRLYVKNIAAALAAALPEQATAIAGRAAAYDRDLAALDRSVKAQIAAVPAAKRKVITTHDAFGYFGRAYGVSFMAPEGLSTEAEPSAAAIAKLNRQIRGEGVRTVFLENMTDTRLIRQIARDTGATVGGTLYSDSLSPPDGPAPDYLALFRNNVPLLVAAMQANGS